VWTTVLGQTFPSPPWAPGQPTRNPNETYILVGQTGVFYDYLSNAVQEYAFEVAP